MGKSIPSIVSINALFLSLIILLGFVSIPVPGIPAPVVLQNMGILLTGVFLNKKMGTTIIGCFLLLVALGLPILAGGRGGIAIFFTPSIGFLFGYLLTPLFINILKRRIHEYTFYRLFIITVLGGVFVINIFGSISIAYFSNSDLSTGIKMVLFFLPGDIVKAILTAYISNRLKKLIKDD